MGWMFQQRQILDSRGFRTLTEDICADAKKAIQEMAKYSQKWHNGTSRGRSTETSDGLAAIQAQLNNLGREIKKVNEKVYAAQVGCEQCKGPHYTKDCPLKEEGKTLEEAYYTQFGGPFQGGGYRATTPGFYQRNNANPSYQERRQSMEDTLSKFMGESAKRHEENSNLIKEIRASTDVAIRNQGASIKTLEIQIRKISKLIHTRYAVLDLPNTPYPLDKTVHSSYSKASHIDESIPQKEKDPGSELARTKLTVELADRTVKYPKGIAENVLVRIGKFTFLVDFIILDMPEDIKVPLILGRPFLSTARAKIDVYKRKITLRVSLRERMELDLEARLMGETLVINRSLDPLNGDYIELNDLNEPFELRRNQGDDLMPTIEEGEVIEEFRTRDEDFDTGIDDYPSYCEEDKKIHIDYKMVYKGDNVVGALMNAPIFVGTFSVLTDFAVLEDMDAYRDEGMGDVIAGESFLKEVGIKARRFDGMITIYNGDDEVTYQMVRSHPRTLEAKSTNIGRGFTNLEILKCWILETSRRLFNTQPCS
ncbi:DNA-directed DNA polymerase [Tanacetum coccineum]